MGRVWEARSGNDTTGGRLRLRALETSDIDFMYQCENDTSLWESSAGNTYFSRHTLAQLVKMSHLPLDETHQVRLIGVNEGEAPVGILDLFNLDPRHARAEIGILIYPPTQWGKGLGKQLLNAAKHYASHQLLLHQLYAEIFTTHSRSLNLFRNGGFTQVGVRRQWYRTPSGWADVMCLQCILTEE